MLTTRRGSRKAKTFAGLATLMPLPSYVRLVIAKQAERHKKPTALWVSHLEILQWRLAGKTTAPEHSVNDWDAIAIT